MSLRYEARPSDSPLLDTVMRGQAERDGSAIRPAESGWHLVFIKHEGESRAVFVGPWTEAGTASWGAGAEILWIKFRLGVFMLHRPAARFHDVEATIPQASRRSFWLNGSAWQIPDFESADVFVDRLERAGILTRDPVVNAVLQGELQDVSPRTLRWRFAQATGLSQRHIQQISRAQRAAALLVQGVSIADTVYEAGYFDQPHLTRSLKRFIGHTPAQLGQRLAVSYKTEADDETYPREVANIR